MKKAFIFFTIILLALFVWQMFPKEEMPTSPCILKIQADSIKEIWIEHTYFDTIFKITAKPSVKYMIEDVFDFKGKYVRKDEITGDLCPKYRIRFIGLKDTLSSYYFEIFDSTRTRAFYRCGGNNYTGDYVLSGIKGHYNFNEFNWDCNAEKLRSENVVRGSEKFKKLLHRKKLSLLNLPQLTAVTDSVYLRYWVDFSLSNFIELLEIKGNNGKFSAKLIMYYYTSDWSRAGHEIIDNYNIDSTKRISLNPKNGWNSFLSN